MTIRKIIFGECETCGAWCVPPQDQARWVLSAELNCLVTVHRGDHLLQERVREIDAADLRYFEKWHLKDERRSRFWFHDSRPVLEPMLL